MTEIPEDIMKVAQDAIKVALPYFQSDQDRLLSSVAAALLAERKRCAEIARTWDDDPYVGSAIAEALLEGGEA